MIVQNDFLLSSFESFLFSNCVFSLGDIGVALFTFSEILQKFGITWFEVQAVRNSTCRSTRYIFLNELIVGWSISLGFLCVTIFILTTRCLIYMFRFYCIFKIFLRIKGLKKICVTKSKSQTNPVRLFANSRKLQKMPN